MSKYTTEVRYICEYYAGLTESKGYDDVEQIIESSRSHIFDFDYPIFDSSYKSVIEKKILRHYYTREIGLETVGLWKLKLCTKMNEIMPYYNKLYKSELIQFNPMYDVDLTTDHQRVNTDKTDGSNSNSGEWKDHRTGSNSDMETAEDTAWNMFSDTPQNGLAGLRDENYMSSATKTTDNQTRSSSGQNLTNGDGSNSNESEFETNFNGTEDYLQHIVGSNGGATFSRKLKEYRETFINIDMRVIDELKDLFMYLW